MTITEKEKELNRDIIFLYNNIEDSDNSYIDTKLVEQVYELIIHSKNHDELTLVLNTSGGNLAAGARLVNILNEMYDSYESIILNRCGSTGTLIALGGDKILRTPKSLITPTEPQIELENKDKVSIALIRNIVCNFQTTKNLDQINILDLGKYYSAVKNFEQLCNQLYPKRKAKAIKKWMLENVNSHNYPMSVEELEKLGIDVETLDINNNFYHEYDKKIIEQQGTFQLEDNRGTIETHGTILLSSKKQYVYTKKYNSAKKLQSEGYTEFKE